MLIRSKNFLCSVFVALGLFCHGANANATYPERPIMITVGYAAGGATDTLVRALTTSAAEILGQPIVVENQPGAGSSIQASRLVRAAPDGYTLGSVQTGALINQHIRETDYDLVEDVTPIITLASLPFGMVVRTDAKWGSMKEFLDYAKENPGRIRYGTAGVGSAQHLTMELLGKQLGIDWVHIPYKSGPETIMAAIRGDVDAVSQSAEWAPFVRDGKLRLLAVFTAERYSEFPDVPTLLELGYDITAPSLFGIAAPNGMDKGKIKTLHDAFHVAMQKQRFKDALRATGWEIDYKNTEASAAFIKELDTHFSNAVSTAGLEK